MSLYHRFAINPLALVISSTLAFSSNVFAEDANAKNTNDDKAHQPTTDETLQVWGTTISSSTSMLSDDIELKQADHLSDLLRDQPGVDVGGTHSMNQSINIRGLSELDLNITIDGASQTNNVFHHVGNLLINPDILKAVDLRVGINSVLNSGLGGGVAFETKDAKDLLRPGEKAGARLFGGIATNDYHHYSGTLFSQLSDNVDGLFYYNAIDRKNPNDGEGNTMTGEEGKTENYIAKLGWDINDSNRIKLSYDYYKDAGDYSVKSNMGDSYPDHKKLIRPTKYVRDTVTLNHELSLGMTEVRSSLYWNQMNYSNLNPQTSIVSEGNTQVFGLNSLAESSLFIGDTSNLVRYGLDAKKEEAKRIDAGTSSGEESADTFAIYAEDEIAISDSWNVIPGVRYNYYKLDMKASDNSFSTPTFGLATTYDITNEWRVRASATELFKGPGLTGSYLESGSSYNPNLKAETGVNYEAGLAYQTIGMLGLDQFGFSFTAFQTDINDYIDDVWTGKSQFIYNDGDVKIQGFESVVNMTYSDFSGRVTYAKSDSEFTSVKPGGRYVVGQSLDDEVGDSISVNLGYAFPELGLDMNWNSQIVFDLDKKVEEDTAKEGYNTHKFDVRWVPTTLRDLTVTASIENIFNEQYVSHASHDLGYADYEPGRNFKLSALSAYDVGR
jgi:hemoglobin/transferrin/lactoferrin receptor protein